MNPINVRDVVKEELRRMSLAGESHEMAARWISERLTPMIEGRIRLVELQSTLAVYDEQEMPDPMPQTLEICSKEQIARAAVRAAKKGILSRIRRCLSPNATHRHNKRGTHYVEVGRGILQTEVPLLDNHKLVAYFDNQGDLWFRAPEEFDDSSRFTKL